MAKKHLSQKQMRAVAALLTEENPKAAAAAAGISYPTIRRYLDKENFQAELQRARDKVYAGVIKRPAKERTQSATTYSWPDLYPKQRQAIYARERYAVIEASTKSGKTFGCMGWLLEKAVAGGDGHAFWWISPSYYQSKIAYKRYLRAIPPLLRKPNGTELTIELLNGAVLWFKSGDEPDLLFGDDVYAAVMDEVTRMREEAWFAVRSTLTATQGQLRMIGNVVGRRNFAYLLARRAESGRANWAYSKLTALDAVAAGVLKAEEVEDARDALPDSVFRELYLAEPTEDGSNPFDVRAIEDCRAPLADGPAICYGVDLAKSVDWTTITGLNKDRHVCSFDRFQQPWGNTVIRIRSTVGGVPCLVDSTGVGDPILEELQKGAGNFEGFKFTSASKQQIMEGLAVAIQKREIRFPEGVIVDELMQFTFLYTRTGVIYTAPAGLHDDCVCGLALANQHFRDGGAPRVRWIGAQEGF